MLSKKIYLMANWKMYLDLNESISLAKDFLSLSNEFSPKGEMVIFPSALAMTNVGELLKESQIGLGAQNTYWVDKGGYTGEVSSVMYKAVGCRYALVGHAERRHVFHETNHDVRQKIEVIIQLGMTPILCIGETLEEKKSGKTEEVIEAQLRAAYMDISWPNGIDPIVAYEPVWAIGTGESCEPNDAEKISALISKWTEGLIGRTPVVLYGGSVRKENILKYLEKNHISGALVGGASAKFPSWSELVKQI